MATAVISPKYQIVIPKEVHELAGLKVGQRVQVIARGSTITLVPHQPIANLRGIAKGACTDGYRDETDRF